MTLHLEERLQRDIDQIRNKVVEMGQLAEKALATALKALKEENRQLAYYVILRDRYIDELELELDRLCQEFLVRQQPAAGHLRFVYSVIKINNEIERVGDYAESIARQLLVLSELESPPPLPKFDKIAGLALPMFSNALQAFAGEDPDLAKSTMELEEKADEARNTIHQELIQLHHRGKLSAEALSPLMIIASRFERAADQAFNICEEVMFMCTGEMIKHPGTAKFRVLFVDKGEAARAHMAVGIGTALGLQEFHFSSAVISAVSPPPKTVKFMKKKGIDITRKTPKQLKQILNLENYEVVILLSKAAEEAFTPSSIKPARIRWKIKDPAKVDASDKQIQAAHEKAYKFLERHIQDLAKAIIGNNHQQEEES